MSLSRRGFFKLAGGTAAGAVATVLSGGLESPANAQDNAVTEAFVNEMRAKYAELPQALFEQLVVKYNNPSLLEYAVGQVNAVYTQAPEIAEAFGANGENVEIITGENALMLTFRPIGEAIFAPTQDGYMIHANGENTVGWEEGEGAKVYSFPLANGLLWAMAEANKAQSETTVDGTNPSNTYYFGAVGNGEIEIEAYKYDPSTQVAASSVIASGDFRNGAPYATYQTPGTGSFGTNGPQILIAPDTEVTTEGLIAGQVPFWAYDILKIRVNPLNRDRITMMLTMTNAEWDVTEAPFDPLDEIYGGTLPFEREGMDIEG